MFDRTSYDRTLYDRSSAFNSVEATLRGSSELKVGLVAQLYLGAFILKGSGTLSGALIARQHMSVPLTGESQLSIDDLRLRLRLATAMSGEGDTDLGVGARVPFEAYLSGSSDTIKYEGIQDSDGNYILDDAGNIIQGSVVNTTVVYFLQHILAHLKGTGVLSSPLTLRVYLASAMEGGSNLSINNKLALRLPLDISFSGSGDIELRRIGGLNSDTLEFNNLNLKPGQTLIIDTDELNVFIDNILDVNSVTSDSVFFSLQPGENEITFVSNVNPNLTVTLIWQNRWL